MELSTEEGFNLNPKKSYLKCVHLSVTKTTKVITNSFYNINQICNIFIDF